MSNITTIVKFPVSSFRKISSPYEEKGAKTYIAVLNVKDVPEELEEWRGLNPRDPKLSSGVAKKIADTLKDDPDSFFFRNRGITIIVDRAEFDNKDNVLNIELSDRTKNGLLDGGHTFRVIRSFVENLSEDELSDFNAYVKIEIIEGIKDLESVVNIVEARNTSTQVKQQGLEELKGHYEDIHNILDNKPYGNRIAYKEFELLEDGSPKDIDIKDILSYLVCFDVESFGNEKHPIKAYSTRSSVVEHFRMNDKKMSKYIPLIPEILELRDIIYLELPDAYNEKGGKFGKLTGVTEVSNRPRMEKIKLPFIEKESRYRIPSGFIYPVLAAFRNIVEIKNDKCSWKIDPIRFFRELSSNLAEIVGDQALEFRNPNKLGKDNATWKMCYQAVELETLRRHL